MLDKIKVKKFNLKYSRNLLTIFNSGRKSGKFFRKSLVKFEDHKQWLEKNLKEKKTNIYLGFKNNFLKPFGYVRFDKLSENQKIYEVSIAILKENYGKGLGTKMLGLALKKFKIAKKLVAIVKKKNIRSYKVFSKNFFKIQSIKKKNIMSKNPFDYKTEFYLTKEIK